jgi:hypothetical protein
VKTTVIAVAGSREHPNPHVATAALADYVLNVAPGPVIVRHGDCPGEKSVDQAVAEWIRQCGEWLGVTEDPMPADWDNCAPGCPTTPGHRRVKKPGDTAHPGLLDDYCPGAGPRRNEAMTRKQPRPAWMLAFPEPSQPSYGTRNCMRLAEQAGIRVRTITA